MNILASDVAYCQQIRHELHACPELEYDLPRTLALVERELDALGVKHQLYPRLSSIVAEIGSGKPVIGLRADMDALPITEENDIPFKSTRPGVMHACGHDAHTALALSLLKALVRERPALHGTFRVYFQANEEGANTGGEAIASAGLMDDLDTVFCYHVDPRLEAGKIGVREGDYNASCDDFTASFHGRGGHAAYPHLAIDPIAMTVEAYQAIQDMKNRELPPAERCVISITMLEAGTAYNVIPESAKMTATVRCYNPDLSRLIARRTQEICESIAAMHKGTVDFHYRYGCPAFRNSPALIARTRVALSRAIGSANVFEMPDPSFGADDFAYYVERAHDGAMLALGVRNEEKGCTAPLHNPRFMIDEDAYLTGLVGYAAILENLMA